MTQTNSATLRSATLDDYPAIERLLTASRLPLDGVHEMLQSGQSRVIVALSPYSANIPDPDVVAVAGLEVCNEHALLRSVAVRSDWQSVGLGSELIRRLVCEAESSGIHALYLLTQTAEHYFPKFGFETIARDTVPEAIAATLEFKSACPASAVAMKRELLVH